jgi:hypothetical protein
LRLQLDDFIDERGDQMTLGSLADMRCAECIDNPVVRFLMGEANFKAATGALSRPP